MTALPSWVTSATALAEVMFATDAGPPSADRLAWLAAEMADFADRIGVRSRLLLRSCTLAVDRGAPVMIGKLGPASRLPFDLREAALIKYEHGPLSLSLFALKAILAILWFEHPDSAAEAGFVDECMLEGGA